MITPDLIQHLRGHFRLDWDGPHGASHRARVRENGLRLAERTQADTRVAEMARSFNGQLFEFKEPALELLATACAGHSEGRVDGDLTVLTCWDADRLDLGRVGIMPDITRMATLSLEFERDIYIMEWAYVRSMRKPRRPTTPH